MTAQFSDWVIIDGVKRSMRSWLGMPDSHPGVKITADGNPGGTACHRGYIATWEIRSFVLYLVDVEGPYALTSGPIKAEWVDGSVSVPGGQILERNSCGPTVYERETVYKVEGGVVQGKTVLTAEDRRRQLREYDRQSELFRTQIFGDGQPTKQASIAPGCWVAMLLTLVVVCASI